MVDTMLNGEGGVRQERGRPLGDQYGVGNETVCGTFSLVPVVGGPEVGSLNPLSGSASTAQDFHLTPNFAPWYSV